jgi:hypothetical protein
MKVKITIIADIEAPHLSDMNLDIEDKIAGMPFVNDVQDVTVEPYIAKKRGS